ncbi:hypothetical protein [Lewinella cohaerens]|uniref:hypothetical protein n=1 Tax=Lewinella cohaerens TaxID=70995 RepID=UPI000377D64F|nr:hypothetical protein [Lewinella cohaerens]
MLKETLNQSLIDLEQSLIDINSARTQVSNVADKSEALIRIFTTVLQNLKEIDERLALDSGDFKERLDESFSSLNDELLKVTSEVSSKSKELNSELDDVFGLFSKKIDTLKIDIESLSKELHVTEARISKLDLKKDFLDVIEQSKKEIDTAFQQKMEELESKISAASNRNLVALIIGLVLLVLVVLVK